MYLCIGGWTICWSIGVGFRVLSFTFISDLSDISALVCGSEGHNLCATIRKSHSVRSRGHMTITALIMGEVNTLVVILDGIGEVEGHAGLLVGWGGVGWWGPVLWGRVGAGSSHDSNSH